MDNNDSKAFKPFIPADRVMPEFSIFAIVLGVILAIVFGGANAYLGLRIGMTVSASIPAAVISMGIVRGVLKRDSILENNMVQTIGSAGESVAAGCIFTIPALFLWAQEWQAAGTSDYSPTYISIFCIAIVGGFLGVLFMIPLRKALIVKEHGVLPYPEGTACAEVLMAGEAGGSKAKITFIGLGIGMLFKIISSGIMLFPEEITFLPDKLTGFGIGLDLYPALVGVGYIIGPRISAYMFAGAALGWFVLMPLIYFFGASSPEIFYPGTTPIGDMSTMEIYSNYLKYIGAGAVVYGGISSLIKAIPTIASAFKGSVKGLASANETDNNVRTNKDLSLKFIVIAVVVIALFLGMTPIIPVGFLGGILIVIFGFFFATVASRIVGLVGSSNSPVSGMTIATLLFTAFIFKCTGNDGPEGMVATMCVGAVICVVAAIAGDTSQDLKTGFIVGATPKKQQIGEFIGVAAAALAIGGILVLLNAAWGFGSPELPAPQATLMKIIVEGVMGGQLPWILLFIGIGIGIVIEILDRPVLPIAIGVYLPIFTLASILVGGVIRLLVDFGLKKKNVGEKKAKSRVESGILFSSGLIAGEGVVGIILAGLAVLGINITLTGDGTPLFGWVVALIFFAILCGFLFKFSLFDKSDEKNEAKKDSKK